MILCIDIGGTKTALALFSANGRKLNTQRFPTPKAPTAFQKALSQALPDIFPEKAENLKAISVAFPGLIEKNIPKIAPNLPKWQGFDLSTAIHSAVQKIYPDFNSPILFENDASLAAVYECQDLPGKNIYLTFSTGIGGGIVEKGRLVSDSLKFEPGHWLVTYHATTAEWEKLASVRAINALNHVDDIKKLSDPIVFQDIALRLALGFVPLIKEQRPRQIVIGGPIALVYDGFIGPLVKELSYHFPAELLPLISKAKKPMECVEYGCFLYAKKQIKD